MGEARKDALKVGFDGSVRLEFHGATVSSDGGLMASRDLDDALALTATAGATLSDCKRSTPKRNGHSGRNRSTDHESRWNESHPSGTLLQVGPR